MSTVTEDMDDVADESKTSMKLLREWMYFHPGFYFTEDIMEGLMGVPFDDISEGDRNKIRRALYYLEVRGEIACAGTHYTKRWKNVRVQVPA